MNIFSIGNDFVVIISHSNIDWGEMFPVQG